MGLPKAKKRLIGLHEIRSACGITRLRLGQQERRFKKTLCGMNLEIALTRWMVATAPPEAAIKIQQLITA